MDLEQQMTIRARAVEVFEHLDDLDKYPAWMPLVHRAEPAPNGAGVLGADAAGTDAAGGPAWDVELRATVGPFARSKQLRMRRVRCVAPTRGADGSVAGEVRFERSEIDGREHAVWRLDAVVREGASTGATGDTATDDVVTELVMRLHYGGRLWTGGILERVLDDHIATGREELRRLVERD